MHRTQIILEESQYLALREWARRTGKSMGQLIREMLDHEFEEEAASAGSGPRGLEKLKGVFSEPGLSGEDHDAAIYGDQ